MSAAVDYAQAGELKFGQVGIANLRVRTLDVAQLVAEMRDRVQRAPNLFARAAVVLDFGGLGKAPSFEEARTLLDGLREAGVLPVALAYGTREIEALSQQADAAPAPRAAAAEPARARAEPPAAAAAKPVSPTPAPGQVQRSPVRSGQQVYADNRDLTVLGAVGAGAEVIADGSIHIYGALRGRALAGAQGNEDARIFCREFHAELVAVAGHYKVLEDIPQALRGKAVQAWLENGQIKLAALD